MMPFMAPMMMGGANASVLATTTWNPLDKGASVILSNGNYRATGPVSSGASTTRSTTSKTSGKSYCEFKCVGEPAVIGISTPAVTNDTNPTASSGTIVYAFNGTVFNKGNSVGGLASFAQGDTIGMALDRAAGTVAFYKNGVLVTTQAGVPLAETFIACQVFNANQVVDLNTGQMPFAYALPSGFSPWG